MSFLSNFLFGSPEKHKRVSTLRKEQEPLYQQLVRAGIAPGAGGAFGNAADYYRDLLDDDSQTAQMMFNPELRRFREDILPSLSEQFAGMGSGGLGSSGFRNAALQAGTDLSERLGAIRAQLRQQGAAGLMGLGQAGLGPYSQDVMTRSATPGLLSQVSPIAGQALGTAFGNWMYPSSGNMVGRNTSPYGVSKGTPQLAPLPR